VTQERRDQKGTEVNEERLNRESGCDGGRWWVKRVTASRFLYAFRLATRSLTHPFTRSSPLATAGSRLILTVVLSLVSSLHSSRSAYASRPLRGERRESEADDVKGGGNQGLTAVIIYVLTYCKSRYNCYHMSLVIIV